MATTIGESVTSGDDVTSLISTLMMTITVDYDNVSEAVTGAPVTPDETYRGVKMFHFVAMGIVIIIGLVCNILSIVVFFSSDALRKTTTGHYLIALMFADTTFLIGELLRWLNTEINYDFLLNLNFIQTNDVACRLTYFLRYAAKMVSAWITVVITTERLLTVTMPLHVATISTPFKAKITIAVVTIICIVLGMFPFWTTGVGLWEGDRYCLILDKSYHVWNMAILRVGSLFLPGIIIFIFTIVIVVSLVRASRKRRAMGQAKGKGVEGQLTAMLVAVSITFLVLRIPYTTFWYLNSKGDYLGFSDTTRYYIYSTRFVADVIATANYATNFFLFCLCGSAFRTQLARLFGRKRKDNRSHSVNTHTTGLATSRSSVQLVGQNGYGNPAAVNMHHTRI